MAQVSLYMSDEVLKTLRADAGKSHVSVSRYVSDLVQQKAASNGWPKGYWENVYGCLDDDSFVIPDELDPSFDNALPSFDD